MKSYSERQIFTNVELATWCDAVDLVKRVPSLSTRTPEIRCHELARAAHECLKNLGHTTFVIDGSLYSIEHSWLIIKADRPQYAILDVYCPGRVPQVQLIDQHFVIARGYVPGETRTDVRVRECADLVHAMEYAR